MPVPVQSPEIAYTANGVTTVFAFPFMVFAAIDLQVRVDGSLAVFSVDYTVTGVGVETGGNVIFSVAPSSGANVTIQRRMPLGRDIEYQYSGDFQSPTVNRDFDRLWMAVQDINQDGTRSLRLPIGDTASTELPTLDDRALRGLAFDVNGDAVAAPASDATSLGVMLQDNTTDDNGAALVGFGPANLYPAGSVGDRLRAIADTTNIVRGSALVGYKAPGTGAVGRTLAAHLSDFVNAADYGVTADGVTDDTAAMNAAIAAGLARFPNGARVLLPFGRIKVSSTIERPAKVFLEGCGMWATEIFSTANAPVIRAVGTLAAPINSGGVLKMSVRGSGMANANAVGIYENWPNRTMVSDVQFFGCAKGHWLQNAWQCEWRNVTAHGAGADQNAIGFYLHETDSGLAFPNNTVMAVNCVAQNCSTYGFRLMHFHGSKFINCEAAGGAAIGWYLGAPVSNFTTDILWGFFANCLSDTLTSVGWRLERGGAPSFRQSTFVNIWAGNALGHSFHLSDCSELTFNGLMGVSAGQNQMRIERSARVVVSGSTFVNYDASNVGYAGIELVDSSNNTITGNQISSAFGTGKAVTESGTSGNNTIVGNILQAGATLVASTRAEGNIGFRTKNTGSTTITSAATSVTFAHGCNFTPTPDNVRFTPRDNGGSATKFWVSAADATNVTINCSPAPGANISIGWQVIR